MFAIRVAALAALVSAAPALAGLDGATISAELRAPNLGTVSPSASASVSPFVVAAGVETVFTVNDFFFVSTDFSNLGLTLTNSELRLNFSGIAFEDGQQIDIAFRPAGGVIPEPATWALLITGFGLVGAAARRRRTATTQA